MKRNTVSGIVLIEIPKGYRLDHLTIDYKLYAGEKQIEVAQGYPVWQLPILSAEEYENMFPGSNGLEESKGWNQLVNAIENAQETKIWK